jgi:general stress protein 26
MFESESEVAALQALLDRSLADAGPHLRDILLPRRMTAQQVVERMQGMNLLTVATVSGDGRPVTGAVDGYLLHGELWFSSGADAVRTRHIRRNPAASAIWLPDETTQFVVHGDAEIIPFGDDRVAELRQAMLDHYVPQQGPEWANLIDLFIAEEAPAFRIVAYKAFAYYRPPLDS